MQDSSKPRYAREIGREFTAALPFNGRWRGRYVWWMQLLSAVALGVALYVVWRVAGGTPAEPGGAPAWAAFWAGLGAATLSVLAETEARVTERHLERRRAAATAGDRVHIPDGYVLAYELGGQPGQLGTHPGEAPYVMVAAIGADRWDLVEPLWRFSVRESSVGGVVVQLPAGSLAGVSALGGFFAELDAGKLVDLRDVERALTARGARDVTSMFTPPPPAG